MDNLYTIHDYKTIVKKKRYIQYLMHLARAKADDDAVRVVDGLCAEAQILAIDGEFSGVQVAGE